MLNRIRQMLGTAATAMDIAYNLSQGLDYKTLSRYILKINGLRNEDAILYETAQCLREILDYELFAFGLKGSDNLDIWIDPRIEDERLVARIREDLCGQNCDTTINHFKNELPISCHLIDMESIDSMLSFSFKRNNISARLYILPGRKMLRYHDEIMGGIMDAVGIALDNLSNMKQLENAAFIDTLTGCYNRRALNAGIDRDIADALRYGRELSVIMFDIDYFKKINDTYGHQAGDAVLSEISGLVSMAVRKSDYLARYGGEEFVLVLSNTGLSNASELAERLRKKIASHSFSATGSTIRVTASFGVAEVKDGYNRTHLFFDADKMLYRAKARGRNTVVSEMLLVSRKTACPGQVN